MTPEEEYYLELIEQSRNTRDRLLAGIPLRDAPSKTGVSVPQEKSDKAQEDANPPKPAPREPQHHIIPVVKPPESRPEPVQPAKPTVEATNPIQPTKPTVEAAEPVQPTKPTVEAAEPIQPTKPTVEAAEPVQEAKQKQSLREDAAEAQTRRYRVVPSRRLTQRWEARLSATADMYRSRLAGRYAKYPTREDINKRLQEANAGITFRLEPESDDTKGDNVSAEPIAQDEKQDVIERDEDESLTPRKTTRAEILEERASRYQQEKKTRRELYQQAKAERRQLYQESKTEPEQADVKQSTEGAETERKAAQPMGRRDIQQRPSQIDRQVDVIIGKMAKMETVSDRLAALEAKVGYLMSAVTNMNFITR